MYSSVICKLVINDIIMSFFLHCKALRTAMYKRYINFIIILLLSLLSQSLLLFFLYISRAQTMHLERQSLKSISHINQFAGGIH